MKYICLNLKRFDVLRELGGVNSIAPMRDWGAEVINKTQAGLRSFGESLRIFQYLPEAHLISALNALDDNSPITVGCQGLHWEDIATGGNFGAFTSLRPATAMKGLGVGSAIIGHCEERRAKAGLLKEAGAENAEAIDRLLNKEALCAVQAGMSVLFCVGEQADERANWQEVLDRQLQTGLAGIPRDQVIIAYEPVWAIGPGKTPPARETIAEVAAFIKEKTEGLPLIYGGGLKKDNAAMLASISGIDGGLIALTRFSGDIGFYPEEYLEIIRAYMGGDSVEN